MSSFKLDAVTSCTFGAIYFALWSLGTGYVMPYIPTSIGLGLIAVLFAIFA